MNHKFSENDLKWRELNRQRLEHASKLNWGFYRNTTLEMYYLLREENRDKQALGVLLEICYLDLNGPQNSENLIDQPDLLEKYPPWDLKVSFLAPKLIEWINELKNELNMTREDIHKAYMWAAESNYKNLQLPVSPDKAWETLSKELGL